MNVLLKETQISIKLFHFPQELLKYTQNTGNQHQCLKSKCNDIYRHVALKQPSEHPPLQQTVLQDI